MRWREYRESTPPERMRSRTKRAVRRRGMCRPDCLTRSIIGVFVLMCGITSNAQDVTGPALKAAFVYQLPKFTEWPPPAIAPGSPFSLCVLGEAVVSEAFERMVKGRDYGGRRIAVSRLAPGATALGCHALYVAQGATGVQSVLAEVRERPVLTISDIDGFTKLGGITQLYFDSGQLRLFIDTAAANRAGLKISSRLLKLSKEP
jgi:hypothetical protein